MPFDKIIESAAALLDERGYPELEGALAPYVDAQSLPESVLLRRSAGTCDDQATAEVLADQLEIEHLKKRVGKGAKNLLRHPKHLVDAWATCELLRRLGFSNDAMTVRYGDVPGYGENMLYVQLEGEGKKMQLCVSPRPAGSTPELALEGWDALWEDVVEAGEDELSVLLARSTVGDVRRVVLLVAELVRQEFGVPAVRGDQSAMTLLANPLIKISGDVGEA